MVGHCIPYPPKEILIRDIKANKKSGPKSTLFGYLTGEAPMTKYVITI